jgi:hypothetical protein
MFNDWIEPREPSLSTSILKSLVFHWSLLLLISLSGMMSRAEDTDRFDSAEYAFFEQAIARLEDVASGRSLQELLSEDIKKETFLAIESAVDRLDYSPEDREELYHRLVRGMFTIKADDAGAAEIQAASPQEIGSLLKSRGEITLETGEKVFASDSPAGAEGLAINVLPAEKRSKLLRYREFGELESERPEAEEGLIRVRGAAGVTDVPEAYYLRKSPYEKILAQGIDLFYAFNGFPKFEDFVAVPEKTGGASEDLPKVSLLSSGRKPFSVILLDRVSLPLPGEEAAAPEGGTVPPLESYKESENIDRLLDSLMQMPEQDQFAYFRDNYLRRYRAENEDLARLTGKLISRNLSNIIVVSNSVSAAFGFLEQLYYSKKLDKQYYEYIRIHPWTTTGVELLFCLASHYDFERRGLSYLFRSYEAAEQILYGFPNNIQLFNKHAKAYVIQEVHEELSRALSTLGYDSKEAILDRYVQEQGNIYELIIQNFPEARNEASYMLGRLAWRTGEYDQALKHWERIDPGYSSNTYHEIRQIYWHEKNPVEMRRKIRKVFSQENAAESQKLLERLVKFNRWAKRRESEDTT